jgi:peptidoglycan hydrolase-like protein with peptidoglycan-binding domain
MTLAIGSRGSQVRSLQQSLASQGLLSQSGVDGVYGNGTAGAVRQFQQQHGLGVDGKAGPQTFQALRHTDSFQAGPSRTPARPAAGTGATGTATTGTRAAGTPPATGERPYQAISRFAQERGFQVTSTTGGHHLGAAHREGRAADIRTNDHTRAQVNQFIQQARQAGYTVFDERGGGNSAWTGPHVHVQLGR